MTQRNPLNERYKDEDRVGKTRKSAASAKPVSKAASSVHEPAPKSKKQKRAEARERERRLESKRGLSESAMYDVPTNDYHRWRRIWWAVIVSAVVVTAISFALMINEATQPISNVFLIAAYALLVVSLYIDFAKVRKLRRKYQERLILDKSKAARAEQKRLRAEAREHEKEAASAAETAEQSKPSLRERLFGGKKAAAATESEAAAEETPREG